MLAGETLSVPPFAFSVYVLPSVPVIVTPDALSAVTVSVADDPALMDAGAAVTLTVGCGAGAVPVVELQPAGMNRAREIARPVQVLRHSREINRWAYNLRSTFSGKRSLSHL